MTLNEFKNKLKKNEYKTALHARRSFGRAGFSEVDLKAARKAVNKKFPSQAKPVK